MSGLFLNPGMGASSARNKSLRPLYEPNISRISRKNCSRNRFSSLESGFLAISREKNTSFFTTVVMVKGTVREVSKLPSLCEMCMFVLNVLIKFITFMTFVMLRGTMREVSNLLVWGNFANYTSCVSQLPAFSSI